MDLVHLCDIGLVEAASNRAPANRAEQPAVASSVGNDVAGLACDVDIDIGAEELDILQSLRISPADAKRLAWLPQHDEGGAANIEWLRARRHRVTASRFAQACGVQTEYGGSQKMLLTTMLDMPEGGRRRQKNRKDSSGYKMEPIAREAYVKARHLEGADSVEVCELGVCVSLELPWLAGSPDGLIYEHGQPVGLLEIKTSLDWRDSFDEDPPAASYLYQMIGCLHAANSALGLKLGWCDLFLWSPTRQPVCRRMHFDLGLWATQVLPSLRSFYFDQYLPFAADKAREKQGVASVKRQRHREARKQLSSSGRWAGWYAV